jgi:RNA polymerase sigma-70 factor, ECF subfamily
MGRMEPAPDLSAAAVVGLDQPRDSRAAAGATPPARAPLADLADVVRRAQDGDEDAFRVLYRAVQPGLLRYVRVLVGDDAEDVASETWLHIARDLPNFRGDLDGFRGWAATIGRNRAMDHLRHQRRRPVTAALDEQLVELPARDDTAESAVDALGTDDALALIATLPRDQAEAVLLRAVMGLDAPAAARVLGKRPGAVRTAAHRGLRKLAEIVENGAQAGETRRSAGDVTQMRTSTLKEVR